MKEVAGVMGDALRSPGDEAVKESARERVRALMRRYPVYPD